MRWERLEQYAPIWEGNGDGVSGLRLNRNTNLKPPHDVWDSIVYLKPGIW